MKSKIDFNKDETVLKSVLTFGISFLIVLICLKVYLTEPYNSLFRKNIIDSNIMVYVMLIIIFAVAVILFNYILSKTKVVQYINKCNPIVAKIIGIIIMLTSASIIGYVYLTELLTFDAPLDSDLSYHYNEPITIILTVCIFFLVVYVVESSEFKILKVKNSRLYFYLFVVTLAIAYGYSFYTPNCFGAFPNIHHFDAYFYSVYRTMMGVPRSYIDTGIYGYYSILLAPIVKILGGSLTSFFAVIAMLGAISLICMAYALDVLIINPIIKVLGTIAYTITIMSMGWTIYFQMYPHRTLFPTIMIAYMCFIYKKSKNTKRWIIGGYILSTLSIIWSTEIGIICLIAWMAYVIFDKFTSYTIMQIRLYKYIFIHIILAILSFASALLFVNIINLLMGGETISLKNFMFPLMASDYMKGFLMTPLPDNLHVWWVLEFCLFCVFLAHCIIKTKFNPVEKIYSLRDKVLFGIVILGMGQITYYINRTAWGNLRIVHYIVILLLCILADWSFNNYKSKAEEHSKLVINIYKSITYIIITFLMVISLGGVSNYYTIESFKTNNYYRDNSVVNNVLNDLENSIPKDTRAIGNGTAELYSYLGWDSYYHIIDFSDIGILPEAIEYMNNELSHINTSILIDSYALEVLDSYSSDSNKVFYDNNTLKKEFDLYEMKFYYFEPNN